MICKFPVNLLVRFQEGFWVCFKFELGSGSFEEKLDFQTPRSSLSKSVLRNFH